VVIGCVKTTAEAIALLKKEKCDIILVDANLPNNEALCLTETISETYPIIKVLVTGLIESATLILPYLEQGATGYVLQNESLSELINKIRFAQREEFIVSPTVATALIARITELKQMATELNGYKEQDLNPMDELTGREREVLKLIEQGCTNLEVARLLMIELGTVKNHVHNIFAKLGVGSRQHAALFARLQSEEVIPSGRVG
jgi:DNA-binding NarL/FixJ family response regulator